MSHGISDERCGDALPVETLLAYHLGELDEADEDRVEEHIFSCATCAQRLEGVERLGAGVRELVRGGLVTASVTQAFLDHADATGLTIRRYHLEPGSEVACTASPDDDFVAIALGMDVAPSESIEVAVSTEFLASGERSWQHFEELSADVVAKELVLIFPGSAIRAIPRSKWTMEAVLRSGDEERRLGPYRLDHTPWEERVPAD